MKFCRNSCQTGIIRSGNLAYFRLDMSMCIRAYRQSAHDEITIVLADCRRSICRRCRKKQQYDHSLGISAPHHFCLVSLHGAQFPSTQPAGHPRTYKSCCRSSFRAMYYLANITNCPSKETKKCTSSKKCALFSDPAHSKRFIGHLGVPTLAQLPQFCKKGKMCRINQAINCRLNRLPALEADTA